MPRLGDFSGKVAVVTGAASGIGLALSQTFARHGLAVVCADCDAPLLRTEVERLRSTGASVLAVPTDVADASSVDELRDTTYAEFGTVHVLCNNAGVGDFSRMTAGIDLAKWHRTIEVDLFGVLHGIRSFLPRMVDQDEGHIVNTASRQGLVGSSSTGAYCTAKFGVVGMSEVLDAELRELGSNVGVSVLCPGPVNTHLASPAAPDIDIDDSLADHFAAVARTVIEPDLVPPLVLRAIETRTLYVSTHAATLEMIEARHGRIAADFAAVGPA
jgi:NAD(P)-dependent dehydrogenase (short-subunit alcohol dehydrogenase family)